MSTPSRRFSALTLTTVLTVAVAISSCRAGGTDPPGEPGDPGEVTSSEALPATGDAGVTTATLLHATQGGGNPSTLAYALDTEQARADFVSQFERPLAEDVLAVFADLDAPPDTPPVTPPDTLPYGTVASIGCDPPLSVRIQRGEAGYEVTPTMPEEWSECIAPVTFVVVFAAPTP